MNDVEEVEEQVYEDIEPVVEESIEDAEESKATEVDEPTVKKRHSNPNVAWIGAKFDLKDVKENEIAEHATVLMKDNRLGMKRFIAEMILEVQSNPSEEFGTRLPSDFARGGGGRSAITTDELKEAIAVYEESNGTL